MALELRLPELGENLTEGTVVRVLVAVGDRVEKGRPVVELETDKAVVEVPASAEGTVSEVKVREGGKVRVGQTLCVLDGPAASSGGEPASTAVAPLGAAPVAKDPAPAPPAVPPAPPNALTPAPRPAAPAGPVATSAPAAPPAGTSAPAAEGIRVPRFASPAVRQAAREVGVDLSTVRGSGPEGRISYGDVLRAAGALAAVGSPEAGADPLPDFSAFGPVERQPFSGIRRTTARRLSHSWATIPHVTQYDTADVTRIEALRKRQAEEAGPSGVRVSVTAILVRIVAEALKAFPRFNASVDMGREEIILKRYVHVGVAVDTEHGLLVPVIRDADRKGALELSEELARLAERARARKLGREDFQGGCFTVSNLGGLGARHFSPIINPPEVAILGVGRASLEAVVVDGTIQPRRRMPLALSYDHRVIDGADAARFMRWVVEAVEEPVRIALGL